MTVKLIVMKYTKRLLCAASYYYYYFLQLIFLCQQALILSLSLSLSRLCVCLFVCMCVAPARVIVHADRAFLPKMFVKFRAVEPFFLEVIVFVDATILQSWYVYCTCMILCCFFDFVLRWVVPRWFSIDNIVVYLALQTWNAGLV